MSEGGDSLPHRVRLGRPEPRPGRGLKTKGAGLEARKPAFRCGAAAAKQAFALVTSAGAARRSSLVAIRRPKSFISTRA